MSEEKVIPSGDVDMEIDPSAMEINSDLEIDATLKVQSSSSMQRPERIDYINLFNKCIKEALNYVPVYEYRYVVTETGTTWQAIIFINSIECSVGYGDGKNEAKRAAVWLALDALIPDLHELLFANNNADPDRCVYDNKRRLLIKEFTEATIRPTPYNVLQRFIRRNNLDPKIKISLQPVDTESEDSDGEIELIPNLELTMTVGGFSAVIIDENPMTARTEAARLILQKMHPQLSWSEIASFYGFIINKEIRVAIANNWRRLMARQLTSDTI